MKFKIVKRCQEDLDSIQELLKSFLPFAKKRMGFNRPPTIFFQSDQANAQKLLGKTAQYEPATMNITLYITGRHPKDVLRSLSHELVHHGQNCRGEFGSVPDTAPGYAQKDNHLRGMEEEAYKVGNLCFRDWEDGVKTGTIRISMPLKESLLREQQEHIVVSGDSLSKIAGMIYGDELKWPLIYSANKDIITNPNVIEIGWKLEIPSESEWDKMPKEKKSKADKDYNMSAAEKSQKAKSIPQKDVYKKPEPGTMGEPAVHPPRKGKGEDKERVRERNFQIGRNFTLYNFTRSSTANKKKIDNTPTSIAVESLKNLVSAVLDPLQDALESKITITSGYRSSELNKAIAGTADDSQHMKGEAVDFKVRGVSSAEVVKKIINLGLPYDQLIRYAPGRGGHIHVSYKQGGNRMAKLYGPEGKGYIKGTTGPEGERYTSLAEWKNKELNGLLLEKFNLGDNRK